MTEQNKLKRLGQVWVSNPRYFITICVNNRRPILLSTPVSSVLCSEWQSAFDRHGWAVGSYVIMPDHLHFFCTQAEQGARLSTFVGRWKEWTSKRIRRETGLDQFAWQKGFFDHLLRSSESYSEKWDYVRQNPVRAGLVPSPEQWPYSGHIHYL